MQPTSSGYSHMEHGLRFCFYALIFATLMNLSQRYAAAELGASPWGLAFWQMVTGGFFLILISGTPKWSLLTNTLRNSSSWMIGCVRMVNIVSFVFAITALTATETCFLLNWNVPFAVLLAAVFMKRQPPKNEWPFYAIMITGLVMFMLRQDGGILNPGVIASFICAFSWALEGFIVENHPEIRRSLTFRDRCRSTGAVMIVTATVFLAFTALVGSGLEQMAKSNQFVTTLADAIPPGEVLFSTLSIASGIIIGMLARGPRTYTEYRAIGLVKTEYYMASMTLLPFVILFVESILGFLGIVSTDTLTGGDIGLGVIVTAAAMGIIFQRMRKKPVEEDDQNPRFL